MNDETPARAKSDAPQAEPLLDSSGDSDEPAFSWLAPAGGKNSGREEAVEETKAPQPDSRAGRRAAETAVGSSSAGSSGAGTPAAGSTPEAAGTSADETRGSAGSQVFKEPLPTSALHVRPPEEEVERRNAQRESAANAKPVAPRVMQVLLAIISPVILLILAVRAVTSPLFLWVEYNRPGFPGDGYGFSTDDRMTYGSYAVDYLSNWAGPRYLGDLVQRGGEKLFKDGEVSHMADVKVVILSTFGAGTALLILALIAILYLRKRSTGGIRRALFAGSIITLVLILGLGTLAALGWQQFFTEFHRIFFADGSWTFSLDDTLIRLFPSQFWIDAGIGIGGMVLLASIITLVLTWPTRRRRGIVREETSAAAEPATVDQP
ncbi:TIGR01906 family membrane protein [Arthrobacter sp. SLBN-112]|uniref:TIGR01906 family membrane protein n=1 Tax=Arthrobacter sp. SLBN-112 TaxID=2768452 RepID=UPI0027B6FD98|nr:TIGR01906 family membrane protein [Arthrobacter sp. SLBN-112]MDQ0801959.1 integral membrane protein (TIGR01906 family) [Arthrobacter sp. SLBN-112]